MILTTLPKSSPPYDFQFAGSETKKTNSGDTSHPVEHLQKSQVKSSHLYLYSAFNNTNCNKALHNIKIGKFVNNVK